MTGGDIRIQSIAWDIETGSMQKAAEWQNNASAFCREKLPAIIENAFERYALSDEIIVIDRIELDLDVIRNENDLEEKFIKSLSAFNVTSLIAGSTAGRPGIEKQLKAETSLLQQFEQYLQQGSLPWSADRARFDNPEHLFKVLTEMASEAMNRWLAQIVPHKNALTRLAGFFTAEQSKCILERAFSPPAVPVQFFSFIEELEKRTGLRVPVTITLSCLYRCAVYQPALPVAEIVSAWWQDADAGGYISAVVKAKIELLAAKARQGQHISAEAGANSPIKDDSTNNIPAGFIKIIEQAGGLLAGNEAGKNRLSPADANVPAVKPANSDTAENKFFVENAGIVLLYPYLKKLFRDKGFVADDYQFKSEKENLAACYWLQFIASGDPDVKEYQLPLAKALCGYPADAALTREWEPLAADKEEAELFLKDVIGNWEKIGKTSVNGFRSSFLLRNGRLSEEPGDWLLYIERKGLDVLLDTLPYPLGIIKLPWMNKPLYVQW